MNPNIISVSPQLSVKDVKATQEYYRDVLGFEVLWLWGENDFGAVGANNVAIYFAHEDDPEGESVLCIDVDDIDAYYKTVKEKGARITSDLETKPWGMREFTVEDLNGNQLRMGMGVKPISEIPRFTQGSKP